MSFLIFKKKFFKTVECRKIMKNNLKLRLE